MKTKPYDWCGPRILTSLDLVGAPPPIVKHLSKLAKLVYESDCFNICFSFVLSSLTASLTCIAAGIYPTCTYSPLA